MNNNNVTTFLRVTDVSEIKETAEKNGRYQTITVMEFGHLSVGNGGIEAKTGNIGIRNLFAGMKTKDGKPMKDHPMFGQLQKGDPIFGSIESFNTTPYQIDGKTVTSAKYVVFQSENPIIVANGQLSSKNACVVDENGVPTRDLTKVGTTNIPATAAQGS